MADPAKPSTVSVTVVSRYLDLTERQVQGLVKAGQLSKLDRGLYDLEDCVRRYVIILRKNNHGKGSVRLVDERTRLLGFQAETAELELRKLRGELIEASEIESAWGDLMTAVRQRILALSTKASPVLVRMETAGEIKAYLDEIIRHILTDLSGGQSENGSRKSHPPNAAKAHATASPPGVGLGGRKKDPVQRVVRRAGKVVDRKG